MGESYFDLKVSFLLPLQQKNHHAPDLKTVAPELCTVVFPPWSPNADRVQSLSYSLCSLYQKKKKAFLRDQDVRIVLRSRRKPSRTLPRSGHAPRAAPCPCPTKNPIPSSSHSRVHSIHLCPRGSVIWLDGYPLKIKFRNDKYWSLKVFVTLIFTQFFVSLFNVFLKILFWEMEEHLWWLLGWLKAQNKTPTQVLCLLHFKTQLYIPEKCF